MTSQNTGHLYKRGETVLLDAHLRYFLGANGVFTVVAQLPPLGNDLQYRIKSLKEPYERVVLEHQLSPKSGENGAASVFLHDRASEVL